MRYITLAPLTHRGVRMAAGTYLLTDAPEGHMYGITNDQVRILVEAGGIAPAPAPLLPDLYKDWPQARKVDLGEVLG